MVKRGQDSKDFMEIKFNTDDNLSLNKPLMLHLFIIIFRCIFDSFYSQLSLDECVCVCVWFIGTEINIGQMKIKNCPDYLFSENLIVNIKDFDSNLLEINKLSCVFIRCF